MTYIHAGTSTFRPLSSRQGTDSEKEGTPFEYTCCPTVSILIFIIRLKSELPGQALIIAPSYLPSPTKDPTLLSPNSDMKARLDIADVPAAGSCVVGAFSTSRCTKNTSRIPYVSKLGASCQKLASSVRSLIEPRRADSSDCCRE